MLNKTIFPENYNLNFESNFLHYALIDEIPTTISWSNIHKPTEVLDEV